MSGRDRLARPARGEIYVSTIPASTVAVAGTSAPPAAGGRPLVSIHDVSKQFSNGTLAIRGVNLDVAAGEFLSLLGPSGCGKSTLLRIIAGLGAPSAGTVSWPTSEHDASGQAQRRLGFVFQDATLMALDEITRHKLNDDLLALWWKQRFTVVFVTHSVFESVYLSQRIVVMAARPGRIMADFGVDAPYPRDNLFRTSAEYGRICRIASDALSRAIAA